MLKTSPENCRWSFAHELHLTQVSVDRTLPCIMREIVKRLAPAKINLALSVGPPRENGLHPICSWMVTVDLFDELELRRLPPGRLSRYAILWHDGAKRRTDIDWSIRNDLAVQAHLALEKHLGKQLPVQLRLDKRIPVGGGLGGGSSNAAAMLHAVNDLFELGLNCSDLALISRDLGSDVPYFVHGGSAIVEGFGEQIQPTQTMPQLHAVLVFPDCGCPTGAVYRRFDELGATELQPAAVRNIQSCFLPQEQAQLFNDLTSAALSVQPELADVRDRLAALAERQVHLSGSGSTWFIVCDDLLHAEHLAGAVESRLQLPAVAVSGHQPPSDAAIE